MKRQRGRNRRNNTNNNHNSNNNNSNRSMDSNGPDVKVRGTASQIHDKYEALARDAASSGNRVKAENLRQHAEHYLRIMNVQEAAKQAAIAAREEAEAAREAERAAREAERAASEGNSDKGGDTTPFESDASEDKPRRQPRAKRPRKSEAQADTPTANSLEVVAPEAAPAADAKPVRRRKAPARKKTDEAAPSAAE